MSNTPFIYVSIHFLSSKCAFLSNISILPFIQKVRFNKVGKIRVGDFHATSLLGKIFCHQTVFWGFRRGNNHTTLNLMNVRNVKTFQSKGFWPRQLQGCALSQCANSQLTKLNLLFSLLLFKPFIRKF